MMAVMAQKLQMAQAEMGLVPQQAAGVEGAGAAGGALPMLGAGGCGGAQEEC